MANFLKMKTMMAKEKKESKAMEKNSKASKMDKAMDKKLKKGKGC